jgi:AraC-like DNA-binding protein
MKWQPYHHDWKLVYSGRQHWRVHWFGRYGGYPEGKSGPSRLAPDMMSFLFIERHSCWARVNGLEMTLEAGDLLVVSGADEFTFGHDAARPHVGLSVSVALSEGGVPNTLLQRSFERRYRMPDPRGYVKRFEAVLAAMASDSDYRQLRIAGALAEWLAYLLEALKPPLRQGISGDRSVVDRVLEAQAWAADRLGSVITLADWAASVGLGPVYFGRIFRRETGVRPMQWLNERRLETATQYLTSTDKPVAEIAGECGFACPFYFSRQFRKRYGLSPRHYRKSALEPGRGKGWRRG